MPGISGGSLKLPTFTHKPHAACSKLLLYYIENNTYIHYIYIYIYDLKLISDN